MRIRLLIVLVTIAGALNAQTYALKGKIADDFQNPIDQVGYVLQSLTYRIYHPDRRETIHPLECGDYPCPSIDAGVEGGRYRDHVQCSAAIQCTGCCRQYSAEPR